MPADKTAVSKLIAPTACMVPATVMLPPRLLRFDSPVSGNQSGRGKGCSAPHEPSSTRRSRGRAGIEHRAAGRMNAGSDPWRGRFVSPSCSPRPWLLASIRRVAAHGKEALGSPTYDSVVAAPRVTRQVIRTVSRVRLLPTGDRVLDLDEHRRRAKAEVENRSTGWATASHSHGSAGGVAAGRGALAPGQLEKWIAEIATGHGLLSS
jgi:hypothetical protein